MDYGSFFSQGAGSAPIDDITQVTRRSGSEFSASQRSTPGIFDVNITQKPCRAPCDIPWHIHDDDLPSNRRLRGDLPPWQRPYLQSEPSEVPD